MENILTDNFDVNAKISLAYKFEFSFRSAMTLSLLDTLDINPEIISSRAFIFFSRSAMNLSLPETLNSRSEMVYFSRRIPNYFFSECLLQRAEGAHKCPSIYGPSSSITGIRQIWRSQLTPILAVWIVGFHTFVSGASPCLLTFLEHAVLRFVIYSILPNCVGQCVHSWVAWSTMRMGFIFWNVALWRPLEYPPPVSAIWVDSHGGSCVRRICYEPHTSNL